MESNKETYTPVQRFWQILKPDSAEIRNLYTYAVFSGLVSLSLPLGIQAIINLIQGGKVSTAWIVLVVFVVFGVALSGLLQIFQLRIAENLQQKIFTRASLEFAYRIPRIKFEEIHNKFPPELMNRYFDVMNIQKGMSKILISISTAGLQVIFGLLLLSLYHTFFIIYSFILVLLLYMIFRYTAPRGLRTSLTESKHKYKLAHWLEEVARTSNSFKLAGKTDLTLERSSYHINNYIDAREGHFKVLVQQYSFLIIFKVIVAAGLLAVGGILVMEQVMNIGQFVAAEIIILLVITSVEKLIVSLDVIYDTLTSLEKVGQVTDLELEESEGIDIIKECKSDGMTIDLNNVKFVYPDSEKVILDHINLNIKEGENIIISGRNASGKSTLLHVIAGLYDVQDGVISYAGMPRASLDMETLRTVIGTCLEEEELFNGSLLENISMGRKAATFENVKWAIEKVGLTGFVKSLTRGYDTEIDPYGKKLSRSIIQKILIARAIADKPKVLLFEYTFEHIDRDDKEQIINFIFDKSHPWTIVATSKDHYLMEKADRIALMSRGEIIEIGSYSELKHKID
jgi:ABC-type bacteriocin/lantibiotic exporter with double-glycine peptidase domain